MKKEKKRVRRREHLYPREFLSVALVFSRLLSGFRAKGRDFGGVALGTTRFHY